MAEAVKFTFDNEFDTDAPRRAKPAAPARKTRFTLEEVEQIRAEMLAEGEARGRASAEAQAAEEVGRILNHIAAQTASLLSTLETEAARTKTEAADLALLVSRKLAPSLMKKMPLAEIEALITECLANLSTEPHLLVRLHPNHLEALQPKIDEMAMHNGFAGKVVLLGDDEFALPDCRIEWADGGVERTTGALADEIEEIVHRYIVAIRADGGAAPETAAPAAEQDHANLADSTNPAIEG